MNDFFAPWISIQRQLLETHKTNLDTVFKNMNDTGFDGATKAAREIGDAQVRAWESWLALWGPKG